MELPTDICASELSLSDGNLKVNTLNALRNVNTRLRALETHQGTYQEKIYHIAYENLLHDGAVNDIRFRITLRDASKGGTFQILLWAEKVGVSTLLLDTYGYVDTTGSLTIPNQIGGSRTTDLLGTNITNQLPSTASEYEYNFRFTNISTNIQNLLIVKSSQQSNSLESFVL